MLTTEERVDRLEVLFQQLVVQVTETSRAVLRMERTTEVMKVQAEMDRKESAEFRQRAEKDRRELARQLADISDRQGTIVEDLIAPSLRRLATAQLDCGSEVFWGMRISKNRTDDSGRRREFDAFFVGEKAVMLNETKTTARPEYATAFVDFLHSGEFNLYFPEYRDRKIVPVFSSLYMAADLITYLTKQKIYAVGMGDETMRVLNLDEVRDSPQR